MATPLDDSNSSLLEAEGASCVIEPTKVQLRSSLPNPTVRKQEGGFDCEFIERPPVALQADCPVCLLVLREPHQATCCGNSFCQPCINRVQLDKKPCPTCNATEYSVFPNKGLKRSLCAFPVRCPHTKEGCPWTGELGELKKHLNENPKQDPQQQLTSCQFAEIKCLYCSECFQRQCISTHQIAECLQRPFTCTHCCNYESSYEDVVTNHWEVCNYHPVPCPNQCGKCPERQHFNQHLSEDCPLAVVNCNFYYAGCAVKLPRKDMPAHHAENAVSHSSLLARFVEQKDDHRVRAEEELRQEKEILKGELEEVRAGLSEITKASTQNSLAMDEKTKEVVELQRKVQVLEKQSQKSRVKLAKQRKQLSILLLCWLATMIVMLLVAVYLNISVYSQKVTSASKDAALNKRIADLEQGLALRQVIPIHITLTEFAAHKHDEREWFSEPFYTHPGGYRLCLSVFANGCGDSIGIHIAVGVYLMRGEFDNYLDWPFQGDIVIRLINQMGDKEHNEKTIHFTESKLGCRVTSGERATAAMMIETFIRQEELDFNYTKHSQYLKHNSIHFQVAKVELKDHGAIVPIQITIPDFQRHNISGDIWSSQPFYTHPRGYKMCLSVEANGVNGTYVSVWIQLMRGEFDSYLKWPFRGGITIKLLNQLEDKEHHEMVISFVNNTTENFAGRVMYKEKADRWGHRQYISQRELSSASATYDREYLKYNSLRFRVTKVELESNNIGAIPVIITMADFDGHRSSKAMWLGQPFYTHHERFKMVLGVYANGAFCAGKKCIGVKGLHVSIFLYLVQEEIVSDLEWAPDTNVTIVLLNQLENKDHYKKTLILGSKNSRITDPKRKRSVWRDWFFISHAELYSNYSKYLMDGCLHFCITNLRLDSDCSLYLR